MQSIVVDIAGVIIRIHYFYEMNKKRYEPFESFREPHYDISISRSRLTEEMEQLKVSYSQKRISEAEAEDNALYRELSELLWKEGSLIFHGVLLSVEDKGFIFTAPSGVGKSYHAQLWASEFGDKVNIINGDKILLKNESGVLWGYGTPWKGKERIGNNSCVKIKAICHLNRGEINEIRRINRKSEAISWLVEQSMLKERQYYILSLIRWFNASLHNVELYELKCNMNSDAAIVAYTAMNKR